MYSYMNRFTQDRISMFCEAIFPFDLQLRHFEDKQDDIVHNMFAKIFVCETLKFAEC